MDCLYIQKLIEYSALNTTLRSPTLLVCNLGNQGWILSPVHYGDIVQASAESARYLTDIASYPVYILSSMVSNGRGATLLSTLGNEAASAPFLNKQQG